MIPSAGPFSWLSCPHYSFELLSWLEYALASGVDGASAALLAMSVSAMAPFASDRHRKYLKMLKDGQWDGVGTNPDAKWKMVPFMR